MDEAAIPETETVYRRIPFTWYPDANRPNSPQMQAFLPRDGSDDDGLSVHRGTANSAARGADETKNYHVAQLLVRAIREPRLATAADESLSVIPDGPAHALIPELNRRDYDRVPGRKARVKEWADALASRVATMAIVVASPRREA
jgi:hypothetical protein